jgi:hypothetical protein
LNALLYNILKQTIVTSDCTNLWCICNKVLTSVLSENYFQFANSSILE